MCRSDYDLSDCVGVRCSVQVQAPAMISNINQEIAGTDTNANPIINPDANLNHNPITNTNTNPDANSNTNIISNSPSRNDS